MAWIPIFTIRYLLSEPQVSIVCQKVRLKDPSESYRHRVRLATRNQKHPLEAVALSMAATKTLRCPVREEAKLHFAFRARGERESVSQETYLR